MANKPLPVILRKFIFNDAVSPQDAPYLDQDIDHGQDAAQVRLIKIGAPSPNASKIPGYFVMSSAPPNIENAKELQESELQDADQGVQEIARHLYDICTQNGDDHSDPELMIAVHGYNRSAQPIR
ncbi:MAG: hypothetical protein AAF243_09975 [Cyanobacteria bacterium P01_A01_bin.137]